MANQTRKSPKAYKDMEFLNSPDARTVRMLSEYLEPQRRFRRENIRDTIVFFGSARIRPRKETAAHLAEVRVELAGVRRPSKPMLVGLRDAELQLEMSRYYEDTVELSRLLTQWAKKYRGPSRFVVCSGGGPGIMEAANRGASLGGGKSIGLNISLPYEQTPNQFVTPGLDFEFHYFFMRKLWFVYLAKALVIFPGGFGTFDELMEVLTLLQTNKLKKKLAVVIYGPGYWNKVINFDEMIHHGVITKEDLKLFTFMDDPGEAFNYLRDFLESHYLGDHRGDQ